MLASATNYNYPAGGNNNLYISNATFGTLQAGDTVFVPPYGGGNGWRSHGYENLSSGGDGQYIVIKWLPGAFIIPNSGGQLQANFLNNCNGVKFVGITMNDNVDVLFFTLGTSLNYMKFIWFDSITIRRCSGFGLGYSNSFANFNGDTTKAFRHWKFTHIVADSLAPGGTGFGGAIGIGKQAANGFWLDVEIAYSTFSNYESTSGPSSYISAINTYNISIHNCVFRTLGMNAASPQGHAAVIAVNQCKFDIYDNEFGPDNFGNDVRGKCVDLPGYGGLYAGRSHFYNNLSHHKRKYALVETQLADTTNIGNWAQRRTGPEIYNNTAYSLAVGVGHSPYNTGIYDCYNNDTATLKNNLYTVLSDTLWTVFGSQVQNALITKPNGPVTFIDSSNNRFIQLFSASGLLDTTAYTPILNGTLYNTGISVPAYITTDKNGTPRPTPGRGGAGVDIGAIQFADVINTIRCHRCRVR
jgi:hypothetical protein